MSIFNTLVHNKPPKVSDPLTKHTIDTIELSQIFDSPTNTMSRSISFAKEATTSQRRSSIYSAQKKQKMSITQTYFLAHSARGKLSREAARADHDLRLLVGHANMLDTLMIDLANAEQEQERWFNKSLSGAREEAEISHQDTLVEEPEADWEIEDAESSDESDYEEEIKATHPVETSFEEVDMEYDDEDDQSLTLTRTASRHSPPELTHDDSDSEDEQMPPSPPNLSLDDIAKKQPSLFSTSKKEVSLESDGFYLPPRQHPTIIAAY